MTLFFYIGGTKNIYNYLSSNKKTPPLLLIFAARAVATYCPSLFVTVEVADRPIAAVQRIVFAHRKAFVAVVTAVTVVITIAALRTHYI